MLLEFALTCLLAGRIAVCEDGVVVEEQFLNVAIGNFILKSTLFILIVYL